MTHLHIAQRVTEAFERALHHGTKHIEPVHTDPETIERWAGWDWASKGGNGYEPEETGHGA